MEQAVQQGKKPMNTAKPNVTHPAAKPLEQPKKKSRWWLWIILAVIVLGAAIGIYYWLFS